MKHLSRRDLESLGGNVIAAYKNTVRCSQIERVEIDRLANQLLGLHVDYRHLSLAGDKLGLTSFSEIGVEVFSQNQSDVEDMYYMLDGQTILIESNLMREGANIGRRNYTVAHECCHHIMRRLFPDDYGSQAKERMVHCLYRNRRGRQDWEEWQVETLAGTVLLPVECIFRGMERFGLGVQIRWLNRVFAPDVYNKFAHMAEFLGVSKTALAIRLQHLNLLKRNDLQDPYALISIEMDKEEWDCEFSNQNCKEVS